MNESPSSPIDNENFAPESFEIASLADEVRVDHLCARLLQILLAHLRQNEDLSPLEAGELAGGADYFLRDFVIADRRENLFTLRPGRVRQFAGNWYIVRNLEPNLSELERILRGVEAFYRFCRQTGRVAPEVATAVTAECAALPYYRQRIEDFLDIQGDGYFRWEAECTLKDRPER